MQLFKFFVVLQIYLDSCLEMVASVLPPVFLPCFFAGPGKALFSWLLRSFSVNTPTPINLLENWTLNSELEQDNQTLLTT